MTASAYFMNMYLPVLSLLCIVILLFSTVIPRHPLPFAAKNMFYDERWLEKQERGFTWWINYVLTPDDFRVTTEVTKGLSVSVHQYKVLCYQDIVQPGTYSSHLHLKQAVKNY